MNTPRFLLLMAALSMLAPAAISAQDDTPPRDRNCVYCHGAEGRDAREGVHRRSGIDCIECHGGVAEATTVAEAHESGFQALDSPRDTVESCGGCHADVQRMAPFDLKTDQLALYRTSNHGKALFEKGNQEIAICTTCHGSHRILPVSDPRSSASKINLTATCSKCHEDPELMERFGLDPQIPAEYRSSIHGTGLLQDHDLASPGCVDCHGSHGAAPPRVGRIQMICGHCHRPERERFRGSPHDLASQRGDMEECTSCHSDHGVQRLDLDYLIGEEGSGCSLCHSDPEEPARLVARRFHQSLSLLDSRIDATEAEIANAALRGIFLPNEEGFLEELHTLRGTSVSVVHAASAKILQRTMDQGEAMVAKTRQSLEVQGRHLRDLRYFAILFLVVSALLAFLLLSFRRDL